MNNNIGANLIRLRKQRKLSYEAIAKLIDVKPEEVLDWEFSKKEPTSLQISKIATFYQIDPSELLEEPPTATAVPTQNTLATQFPQPKAMPAANGIAYTQPLRVEGFFDTPIPQPATTPIPKTTNTVQNGSICYKFPLGLCIPILCLAALMLIFFALPLIVGYNGYEYVTVNAYDVLFSTTIGIDSIFYWLTFLNCIWIITSCVILISSKKIANGKFNFISKTITLSTASVLALLALIIIAAYSTTFETSYGIWLIVVNTFAIFALQLVYFVKAKKYQIVYRIQPKTTATTEGTQPQAKTVASQEQPKAATTIKKEIKPTTTKTATTTKKVTTTNSTAAKPAVKKTTVVKKNDDNTDNKA